MLAAGADLIQVYTGLIYRGPGLVRELVAADHLARQSAARQPPQSAIKLPCPRHICRISAVHFAGVNCTGSGGNVPPPLSKRYGS